ncbi:MAG: FAA hydrolase family protein [Alphaproteobacteria bacterium]|nr:MAG: FAA hydrolase family protein [Alphaproteobacteria bacterium]
MRLALIETANQPALSLVKDGRFLPVSAVNAAAPNDLAQFLAWVGNWQAFVTQAPRTGWLPVPEDGWRAPLSPSGRIFCIGKNYADHAREMGMASGGPVAPDIFIRFASSFVGHRGTTEFPEGESSFDFEGELVVVIGKAGRHIAEERALDHVFGYTAANDGSLRRIQKRTSQFSLGKNIDRSGALGPTIVPAGEIANPQGLALRTRVNDRLMQDGTTADMTFPIATVIAVLSSVTELQPGDIILTGTPAGVGAGRTPPEFLHAGDRIRIDIDGLDSLEMTVAQVPGRIL